MTRLFTGAVYFWVVGVLCLGAQVAQADPLSVNADSVNWGLGASGEVASVYASGGATLGSIGDGTPANRAELAPIIAGGSQSSAAAFESFFRRDRHRRPGATVSEPSTLLLLGVALLGLSRRRRVANPT